MNDSGNVSPNDETQIIETLNAELEKAEPSRRSRILEKFVLAALSSIPWVGGVLSAAESFRAEAAGVRQNSLQTQWLREHQRKIDVLWQALEESSSGSKHSDKILTSGFKVRNTSRSFVKPFAFWIRQIRRRSVGCSQMSSPTRQAPGHVQMM